MRYPRPILALVALAAVLASPFQGETTRFCQSALVWIATQPAFIMTLRCTAKPIIIGFRNGQWWSLLLLLLAPYSADHLRYTSSSMATCIGNAPGLIDMRLPLPRIFITVRLTY